MGLLLAVLRWPELPHASHAEPGSAELASLWGYLLDVSGESAEVVEEDAAGWESAEDAWVCHGVSL